MFWKRKHSKKKPTHTCAQCGAIHEQWPALAFPSPINYHVLSEQEKTEIAKLNADFCEIQHPDQIGRFIRVVLTQKVHDACEDLEYGLWVSLSEKSYADYRANFNNTTHEAGYFGWLCSHIPEYDHTESIPCDVITKKGNERPEIFPHQDFDHPFVKDYYQGISKAVAERRIKTLSNW